MKTEKWRVFGVYQTPSALIHKRIGKTYETQEEAWKEAKKREREGSAKKYGVCRVS